MECNNASRARAPLAELCRLVLVAVFALLLSHSRAAAQVVTSSDGALRAPAVVQAGSTTTVEVAGSAPFVEVTTGRGAPTRWPVGPDGKAQFPAPDEPGVLVFAVSIGTGLRCSVLLVEVVAP